MSDLSNEALETAIRDYVGAVLDSQGEIMTTLADLKVGHQLIRAEIAGLEAAVKALLAEHAAELDSVAATQAETLAAVKSVSAEIAHTETPDVGSVP